MIGQVSAYLFFVMAAVGTTTPEQELAWLDSADPQAMLNARWSSGQHRFLAVCGFSCSVAGVGSLNAARCYPSEAVEPIKGTSDVTRSEEHARLQRRARDFAARYNLLLAERLRSKGLSACTATADWDAAFGRITKYVSSLSGTVAATPEPREKGYDFSVKFGAVHDLHRVGGRLCAMMQQAGILQRVRFVWQRTDQPNQLGRIECLRGRVAMLPADAN